MQSFRGMLDKALIEDMGCYDFWILINNNNLDTGSSIDWSLGRVLEPPLNSVKGNLEPKGKEPKGNKETFPCKARVNALPAPDPMSVEKALEQMKQLNTKGQIIVDMEVLEINGEPKIRFLKILAKGERLHEALGSTLDYNALPQFSIQEMDGSSFELPSVLKSAYDTTFKLNCPASEHVQAYVLREALISYYKRKQRPCEMLKEDQAAYKKDLLMETCGDRSAVDARSKALDAKWNMSTLQTSWEVTTPRTTVPPTVSSGRKSALESLHESMRTIPAKESSRWKRAKLKIQAVRALGSFSNVGSKRPGS